VKPTKSDSSVTAAAASGISQATRRIRGWIVVLLFFSTVINYLDRQNLSILARTIQNDLHISDLEYSNVVQAFLLAYTLSYLAAGRLTDWLGTRASMAVFVVWWSISDMLTSLSRSAWMLGGFRFLLGMGEPGNYTAAPKAVAEWFAPKERALVIGIYTAGATLGATIAPPVIAFLASRFGWHTVFLFTGSLGLCWVIPWLWLYRRPEEHPRVSPGELQSLRSASGASAEIIGPKRSPWIAALRSRETWLLTFTRLLTDPVWYFYLFWFPKYLGDARHMSLLEVGRIAWIVYLAADAGCILGGALSGKLIQRGFTPPASRIRVMAIAAVLLPLSPLVPHASSPLIAVLIGATAAFAHLLWQTSLSALVVDLYPKYMVGTVFGIVAAGSGLGGMISTNLIGRLVTHYSYTPVFLVMGFLHPLAFLLVRTLRKSRAGSSVIQYN
jgi:ACS family hexuronate transporter-like MFS transporter